MSSKPNKQSVVDPMGGPDFVLGVMLATARGVVINAEDVGGSKERASLAKPRFAAWRSPSEAALPRSAVLTEALLAFKCSRRAPYSCSRLMKRCETSGRRAIGVPPTGSRRITRSTSAILAGRGSCVSSSTTFLLEISSCKPLKNLVRESVVSFPSAALGWISRPAGQEKAPPQSCCFAAPGQPLHSLRPALHPRKQSRATKYHLPGALQRLDLPVWCPGCRMSR